MFKARGVIWALLALCCSILILGGWESARTDPVQAGTDKLLAVSRQIGMKPAKLTYKMGAQSSGSRSGADFQTEGDKLARMLHLPAAQATKDNEGHPLYTVQAEVQPGIRALMVLIGSTPGQAAYLQLDLTASSAANFQEAEQLRRQVDRTLRQAGYKTSWSVDVQGMAGQDMASDERDLRQAAVPDAYAGTGRWTDGYRDVNSWSAAYVAAATDSRNPARADNRVQAALHRLTTDGQVRLTLGAPYITVEF